MRIRMHSGTLSDSMNTLQTIEPTRQAVLDYLKQRFVPLPPTVPNPPSVDLIVVEPYRMVPDIRVGWDQTFVVNVSGYPVAMTDGPLEGEWQ